MQSFLRHIETPHWIERLPRPLVLGGFLSGLLVYSTLIGIMFGTNRQLIGLALLALPVLIVGFTLLLYRFEWFVLILPLTGLAMRPLAVPAGNGSELPISMLLTLALSGGWILSMITRRTWQLAPSPLNKPLLAMMAICIFSVPWGLLWADPIVDWWIMGNFRLAQIASLLSFLGLLSIPLLVGRFIQHEWQIKAYLGMFIVCGLLMTAAQTFGIDHVILVDMGLWGLWFALPLAGITYLQPGIHWRWKLIGTIILCWHLWLAALRNSLWISGWLPTIVGLFIMAFLTSRRIFFILLLAFALNLAVGPGRYYVEQVINDNVEEGGLDRLEIWARNLWVVRHHWLFGTGVGGYAIYNMTYFRYDARSTHNNYFDILAQFGVVGSGIWLWFAIVSLYYGWQTIWMAPVGILRTTAIVATSGWAAAQFSMMLGDWVLPFLYNQGVPGYRYTMYSWIFVGLLISIRQMIKRQTET
ncbi:O-antigen ligase family protein [Chloroflexus sp. MS-CIW-1]|uniref:O-antigen ligase family protein n=1 Tax=Chloroflexus sp. MS-CIW-1 TaxID=3055768 RepID=UPI0026487793|nr:O-antigen ligase family protein [Chloroflexus sp. MS-CIW-1]MDN5272714.1 O-antigen ligase family protein [Chloroflexus sp. MS-CIW-1]